MRAANSTRGQQTRGRILDVALSLFAARGYAGTSIHDLAGAAKVAKPALYHHFGSKDGLFRALMEQAEEEAFSVLSKAAERSLPTSDRMLELCVAAFWLATHHGEVIRLALGHSLLAKGAMPARILCPQKARRRRDIVRKLMDQGLADGTFRRELDAEQLTLAFVGLLQAHIMVRLANPRHSLNRRVAEGLVDLFLHGVGADSQQSGDKTVGLGTDRFRDGRQR